MHLCAKEKGSDLCMCVSEGEEDGWKAFDRVCLNRELLWRITAPLIRAREEVERRKMGERVRTGRCQHVSQIHWICLTGVWSQSIALKCHYSGRTVVFHEFCK